MSRDKPGPSLLAETATVLGSRGVILAAGFITSILLARALGPEGRGLLATLTVVPFLAISLFDLGIRQAAVHLVGSTRFDDMTALGAIVALAVITGLIATGVSTGYFLMLDQPELSPLLIGLAVGVVPVEVLICYLRGFFLGKGQIGRFNQTNWIPAVGTLGGVAVLVYGLGLGIAGALAATLMATLLVGIRALWLVLRTTPLRPHLKREVVQPLLTLGVAYAAALFMLNLNYRIDIVMLSHLGAPAELGLYSLAVMLAELLWQIPAALGVIVFSRSARGGQDMALSRSVAGLARLTVLLCGLCALAIAPFGPAFIRLVYGQSFAASADVLILLLPGIVLYAPVKVLNMDLCGRGRPLLSLWMTIPTVLLNVALNLFLIPRYGAQGAAVASSISYTLGCGAFAVVYARSIGLGLGDVLRPRLHDFTPLAAMLSRARSFSFRRMTRDTDPV